MCIRDSLDSGVAAGSVVPGSFDSLMAKLIVTGATRDEALARAARALAEFRIEGVASVLPFHRAAIAAPEFRAKNGAFGVHTRWIETDFADRLETIAGHARVTPAPAEALLRFAIEIDGKRVKLGLPAGILAAAPAPAATAAAGPDKAEDTVAAPVAGLLQVWQVADGADVEAGEVIAVMEAMKMETRVEAPWSGRLHRMAEEGASIAFGAPLARVTPA